MDIYKIISTDPFMSMEEMAIDDFCSQKFMTTSNLLKINKTDNKYMQLPAESPEMWILDTIHSIQLTNLRKMKFEMSLNLCSQTTIIELSVREPPSKSKTKLL